MSSRPRLRGALIATLAFLLLLFAKIADVLSESLLTQAVEAWNVEPAVPTILLAIILSAGIAVLLNRRGTALARRKPDVSQAIIRAANRRLAEPVQALQNHQYRIPLRQAPEPTLVYDPTRTAAAADGGATTQSVYESVGHRLLIVGDEGAGKTLTACELAWSFKDRNPGCTILLISLSAWEHQAGLDQFIVDYVSTAWSLDRPSVADWVVSARVFIVLDGLDEVAEGWRSDCLHRINEWLVEHPTRPVILTCRTTAYLELAATHGQALAYLPMAIRLLPLDDNQLAAVYQALAQSELSWQDLAVPTSRGERFHVRNAMRSPLFLQLVLRSEIAVNELRAAGKRGQAAVEQEIVERFLATSLRDDQGLTRWVSWVAAYLAGSDKYSVPWLAKPPADRSVFELSRLHVAQVPFTWVAILSFLPNAAFAVLITASASSVLVTAVFASLVGAMFAALTGLLVRDASPATGRPHWSRQRLLVGLMGGYLFGALAGIVWGFATWWSDPTPAGGLLVHITVVAIINVLLGMPLGIAISLFARQPAWTAHELSKPWRSSVIASTSYGVATSIGSFLLLGVNFYWPPYSWLPGYFLAFAIGYAAWMWAGGLFLLMQGLIWIALRWKWGLSARPVSTLKRGIKIGILQGVGAGVRFPHNAIRDALAERAPTN